MKLYELIFNEEKGKGCYKVSTVKDSAVETVLLKFNKEHENEVMFFANEEKRIFYCVAARPNKLIFRKNVNGEPAQVFYTEETVEKMQKNYFKQNGNSATNLNHDSKDVDGLYPFESWIVRDNGEYTKEHLNGFETFKGDWIMAFSVENDDVWNECKKGNLNGLSIEAYFGYKETSINFKQETGMKIELMKFFKTIFGADPIEIATGFWAKDKVVGTVVLDKDGNPAANAEMEIDGKKVKTDAEGKILAEVAMEDELTLEQAKDKIATLEKELADVKKDKVDAETEKTKAETELETMKSEKEKIEANLVTMTSEKTKAETAFEEFKKTQTPAKKIENKPIEMSEEKAYENMTNFEKMKFNKERKD